MTLISSPVLATEMGAGEENNGTVVEVSLDDVTLSDESVANIAQTVAEYNTADGYNLGTTYVSIFQGVAYKVPFGQHYVYWRNSQNEYCFAYGKLSYDGSFYSSDPVTVVTYSYDGQYNSQYSYEVSTDSSFSLSVGDSLVYSDLGDFPDLINRKEQMLNGILSYTLVCIVIWTLFNNLRKAPFGR